ncbi:hypothetical protein I553_7042 [Mycobacterium xenopi 4042]|uniref:Uncharacterized protein n=1 Tax=Mycobacterium xenopi 4042 TaxID=1299334 RepID=X7Z381_MYCXE|nr:hypothetical protein I553_7042 [Mycobacterium xenopi 4042]
MYTVMLIGDSAPLLNEWARTGNFSGTTSALLLDRPSDPETPVPGWVAGPHTQAGFPELHHPYGLGEPLGLSMLQTLHLVGPDKKGYKMF